MHAEYSARNRHSQSPESASGDTTSLVNYPDLGEKVYELLKREILTVKLAPGSRLSTVDLAARLGVSRTPVQDALGRLSVEGFVEHVPRKGYFVAKLDPDEVNELLDARLMLELAAIDRGIDLVDSAQIREMWRVVDEMEQLVDEDGRYHDYAAFQQLDCAFHLLVVGTAKNRRIVEIYRSLFLHMSAQRIHFATAPVHRRGPVTLREHKRIVEAFEARDRAALRAAITDHLREAARWFAVVHEQVQQLSSSGAAPHTVQPQGAAFS